MNEPQIMNEQADEILSVIEEMTPQELEALEAEALEASRLEEERRVALSQLLVKNRNAAVTFRITSGIETQWREDQAYYEGQDYVAGLSHQSVGLLTSTKDKEAGKYKSKVFLNITRPYVETAASKVIEVLAPADERSWSLSPSLVPNLPDKPSPLVEAAEKVLAQAQPQQVGPDGQPVQQAPAAPQLTALEEALKTAHRAARGAEIWIDDKLQTCQFQAVLRAVVDEASRLGTGVARGPVPTVRRAFKVDESGTTIVSEEIVPDSRNISVWDA